MISYSLRWFARSAGIIGLPNVGKSTLFNALTCSQYAKTGNYPFCTIDANIAKACVVDKRLDLLAAFSGATKIVYVELELADVAGLIEGASHGAGLGNKFLADIRPCRVLLHTVRCFEDASNGFDEPQPLEDIKVVTNELALADLEFMEKRLLKLKKTRKADDPEYLFALKVFKCLEDGEAANKVQHSKKGKDIEVQWLKNYELLTAKPIIYVLNVDENNAKGGNNFSKEVEEFFNFKNSDVCCRVSVFLEEQLSQMTSREERLLFLSEYGIEIPQSEELLMRVMKELKYITFFTIGPQMAYAWLAKKNSSIREAAGLIHSDFAKNFVKAHVISWENMLQCHNLQDAERQMQVVDEHYDVKDGDVVIIDHNCSSESKL